MTTNELLWLLILCLSIVQFACAVTQICARRNCNDRPKPIKDGDSDRPKTIAHTPPTHATPGECSTPREGTSEPVAWWLRGTEYDTGCEYEYVSLLKENAEAAAAEGGTVVPLYRAPTLTDAEREAVTRGAELADHSGEHSTTAAALRGLLKRLK